MWNVECARVPAFHSGTPLPMAARIPAPTSAALRAAECTAGVATAIAHCIKCLTSIAAGFHSVLAGAVFASDEGG